jgi:hypothetical protein
MSNLNIIEDQGPVGYRYPHWVANLFLIWATWQYGWSLFLVMYIFWFELIIDSVFYVVKMFLARNRYDDGIVKPVITPHDSRLLLIEKFWLAIKFLVFRAGIFFFYLLFLVVFIGFGSHSETLAAPNDVSTCLTFSNRFMNIAIGNFVLAHLIDLIGVHIVQGRYLRETPNDSFVIFDLKIIVIHVSTVLGVFIAMFLSRLITDPRILTLVMVAFFVLIRTLIDLGAGFVGKRMTT